MTVGKWEAASALLSGQKFGYTSADKVVGRILEKTGLDKKDIGRKSQKFEDASKRFTESLEGDLTRQSAHDLAKTLDSKITTLRIAISGVDFICKALFGVSPIDEWVRKPFFGDWDELRDTAGKWQSLAETLPEVQTALLEISIVSTRQCGLGRPRTYMLFAMRRWPTRLWKLRSHVRKWPRR